MPIGDKEESKTKEAPHELKKKSNLSKSDEVVLSETNLLGVQ
jgi:hypothetical protein